MAENLCVKMGGGVQKWDLLWENPNPFRALTTSVTINVDTTKYDALFVNAKGYYNFSPNEQYARLVQIKKGDRYFNVPQPTDAYATHRSVAVTDTSVTFGTAAGYRYYSDGGGANSTNYGIPLALYGVKKVKLGE